MRISGRKPDQLRNIELNVGVSPYAEGSCMVTFGKTTVLCTATVDEKVPPFMKNKGTGWVTAEYGMLPRSTHERMKREAANGKQGGRTVEIQRLIGRSLRSIVNLKSLGERQIIIDCDVIQADGGTRCASITGGYVALYQALHHLKKRYVIREIPIKEKIAAVSCGIVNGEVVTDLEYLEDSKAEADANFVMTSSGKIVEIQATAESYPFAEQMFQDMLQLAKQSIKEICLLQDEAIQKFLNQ